MIRGIGPEEYDELCRRVGTIVQSATPPEAVVAIVSKGDPRLLEIEGRAGVHFPSDAEGRYAGFYPRTSEEAIAQLEAARGSGAEFLCLPATALWWLEHYQGFAAWLGARCRVVARDPETCVVYDLLTAPTETPSPVEPEADADVQVRSLLDSLLPADAMIYAIGIGEDVLAAPGRTLTPLRWTSATELRRRIEGTPPHRPTFVLVDRSGSGPPLRPAVEEFLLTSTQPVARRAHLCDLFQVKAGTQRSRIGRSPSIEDASPDFDPTLGSEAADELSRRLERLGLSGQDGVPPTDPRGA
jgi:hypothetical protein